MLSSNIFEEHKYRHEKLNINLSNYNDICQEDNESILNPSFFAASNDTSLDAIEKLEIPTFEVQHDNKKKEKNVEVFQNFNKIFGGEFVNTLRNPQGNNYLTQNIPNLNGMNLAAIFHEIYPKLPEMLLEGKNNKFCENLFGHLNPQFRMSYIKSLGLNILRLSSDQNGINSLIDLFKKMNDNEKTFFLNYLNNSDSLFKMTFQTTSLYFLKFLMLSCQAAKISFIYEFIGKNFSRISTDKESFILSKMTVENASFDVKLLILREITENFNYIIDNQCAFSSIISIFQVKLF